MKHALTMAAWMLLASAAGAADEPAADSLVACNADFERLCPGVAPGDGRVKACFKEHRAQLSAECKKELLAARKKQAGK